MLNKSTIPEQIAKAFLADGVSFPERKMFRFFDNNSGILSPAVNQRQKSQTEK